MNAFKTTLLLQLHQTSRKTIFLLRQFLPLSLLLCLLISCSACESDLSTGEVVLQGDDETAAGVDDPTTGDFAPFAIATLSLINEVRSTGCQCGDENMPAVPVLGLHPQLTAAAQSHSEDQAAMGQMQHRGSDGSTVSVRLTRAGFTWRSVGENVAWNYPDVEAVIAGWLSSAGHCRNIMNADYRYMGMGEEDLYWTQVFAR
jgi:uncharacterized protein YkwD